MKTLKQIVLRSILTFILIMVSLANGTSIGAEDQKKNQNDTDDEFMLEEITVTAQFRETDLQKTPIAITAVTGEMLEDQNILSVQDLGLIIPNADIRQQGNTSGPNARIGLRGVGQSDFIPAFEPGVGVYVDDIYQETLVGSTLDLLDLERVEVLRGPQGTLFGKNSLGGAIRLISKVPRGDNTGHFEVTGGTYNRIDFNGAYDFALIDDILFARISASSKKIDGYMDRLDFTCQMIANGTPELAGTFPTSINSDRILRGECKIGEKGGSQSDAAKIMLRYVPTPDLEFNFGFDYTEIVADMGAEVLLKGSDPEGNLWTTWVQDNIIGPTWGFNMLGDIFVTGNYYTSYESGEEVIRGKRFPVESNEDHTNFFAKVDYDLTDKIHLKGIFGYREYEQVFGRISESPLGLNAYFVDMIHDQKSYELRLSGMLFNDRMDWTTGIYYFESNQHYGGFVNMGAISYAYEAIFGVDYPEGFENDDNFTTDSRSAFAHMIYKITDKLSLTGGGRYTDEDKTFSFSHVGMLTIDTPLEYGQSHYDWNLSSDYQFTDDIMAYFQVSTGFRSEGANPRPWTRGQLLETPGEEMTAYELGSKTSFFDNRLRINAAAFINDYDSRLYYRSGAQCTNPLSDDAGEVLFPYGALCPEGTFAAGTTGTYWYYYDATSGTSKGLELDVMARPINNLHLNGSFGYYKFKSDVNEGESGFIHPDFRESPEFTYNIGAQYDIHFSNGSMLSPRIDMFYQGERDTGDSSIAPISQNVVPDYTVYNARLTYMPASVKWSVSFEVKNLFDKFYWISLDAAVASDGVTPIYDRKGVPSPPRMMALTFRYNLF